MTLTRERVEIMGVPVDRLDVDGAAEAILKTAALARSGKTGAGGAGSEGVNKAGEGSGNLQTAVVCTPNAEIMMSARKNRDLLFALRSARFTLVDGAGVVLAARILGLGRLPRAPGYDVSMKLLESGEPLRVYLFGGKPGVAETAARNLRERETAYTARVVGLRDGYFGEADEDSIIDAINAAEPDILFVALGAPKQELWMTKHSDRLRVPVCIGVGGTLDVIAGTAKLAPPVMRRLGLEWLYRLIRQPSRAIRMLKLPQYIMLAALRRLRGRRRSRRA